MLVSRALTRNWASSVALMLFQVIFVFSLRHTIRSWKDAKALIVHYICAKFAEIQCIYLNSMLF